MLIIVTLFLVGISLRAHQLGRALGGGDENQVLLEWVYTPIEHIVTTYGHGSGGHHIFHTIVLRMMVLLFGEENELAIRFPAFAAGIACLWFIYKIASQIFRTKMVAQLALLATVVCPVHIYYSQTARGYSFLMLFSTLSIYATLKLLNSDKYFRWGLLLLLSGFLLVYTQPIAVIFILALALWVFFVLAVPALRTEFGLYRESIGKKIYPFLSVFLLIGICSFLSYWPLLGQMVQSYEVAYKSIKVYSSSSDILIHFIPNLFLKILPGPLIYFTPFFIAGIFLSKTCNRSYRLLPITILLTTYLVSLITGLAHYPRAYLFNLPMFLIFLVSGLMWFGEGLRNLIKYKTSLNLAGYSLMSIYVALALIEVFLNHYPSTKTYNPKEYRQSINSQIQSNNLFLVADPKNYLYARSIYKNNLQNIITNNQLDAISLLVNNTVNIEDYYVKTPKGYLPVFLNWQNKHNFKSVSNDKKLIHLNNIKSTSLLPKDFESTVGWKIISGTGEFTSITDHKFTGENSLSIKAFPKKNVVLQRLIGQVKLDQPHLVVLAWSAKKFSSDDSYFLPALGTSSMANGKKHYRQIALGKINEGMSIYIKEKSSYEKPYYWEIDSAVGWLPAGEFSLNLLLNCEAGKSILYDSLRLFLINHSPQSEEKVVN